MSAPREVIVHGRAGGFAQTIEVDGLRFVAGLYARKHGWPLEDVTVRLLHARVHETDCEECVDHPRQLDRITLAAKCPVHATLTSKIDIQMRS